YIASNATVEEIAKTAADRRTRAIVSAVFVETMVPLFVSPCGIDSGVSAGCHLTTKTASDNCAAASMTISIAAWRSHGDREARSWTNGCEANITTEASFESRSTKVSRRRAGP